MVEWSHRVGDRRVSAPNVRDVRVVNDLCEDRASVTGHARIFSTWHWPSRCTPALIGIVGDRGVCARRGHEPSTAMSNPVPPASGDGAPSSLLASLRDLITQARKQVLRHVDVVQVQTYWQIGRHIVESSRAAKLGRPMANDCCRSWDRPCRASSAKASTRRTCATCGCSTKPSQTVTHCATN